MEHDTAGDPVSGIKWTRRTTDKVADELRSAGIDICPNTVAKLLKGLGYRLRVNAKELNRQKDPGRDAQFAYIAAKREAFAKAGLPVVSVDSKHREMVGEFKNPGTTWAKEPVPVLDHDFLSDATGVALPYGVYDLAANHACVTVGTSHDTPDFAVDNLARWWEHHGRARYPGATELLVLAGSGGVATGRAAEPGSTASSTASATAIVSRSLFATTRAAPPSTTQSSTGHSARSARTGPACR
jgi:hypothetical protein